MTIDHKPNPKPERPRLAVCVNHRFAADRPSCGARKSEKLADALEKAIAEAGLNFEVERHMCFGRCGQGPTMRFIPGGDFHFQVTEADIPSLIEKIKEAYSEDAKRPEENIPVHLLGS